MEEISSMFCLVFGVGVQLTGSHWFWSCSEPFQWPSWRLPDFWQVQVHHTSLLGCASHLVRAVSSIYIYIHMSLFLFIHVCNPLNSPVLLQAPQVLSARRVMTMIRSKCWPQQLKMGGILKWGYWVRVVTCAAVVFSCRKQCAVWKSMIYMIIHVILTGWVSCVWHWFFQHFAGAHTRFWDLFFLR